MGKVKKNSYSSGRMKKYQFPMGKVKYKVDSGRLIITCEYQFPMGKVKNKI